jgi:hypothetical protein
MLTKCQQQEFTCVDVDYSPFDDICAQELKVSIDADLIVNNSEFCTLIPISDDLKLEHLESSDYLKGLRGKVGVYHLWVDYDNCDDHEKYTMMGVYVGKGFAEQRINSHINDKFPNADHLYVSFFECENRLAKYIEQLFLDQYKFYLNKAENCGEKYLFAVWDEDRHHHGTETYEIANIYAKRIGPGPYEV